MNYQVLKFLRLQPSAGQDVQGASETVMCNSSDRTRTAAATQTVERVLLALPHSGVTRGGGVREEWVREGQKV